MSLAYLAGLIASDGHLGKQDYKIQITTTNFSFATAIRQLLANCGTKASIYKGRRHYEIYTCNKSLWESFVNNFKIPFGKKSYDLQDPKIVLQEDKISFLKGLLDGDSSIFETRTVLRRQKKTYRYFVPRIEYASKSKAVVDWSIELMKELGMKPYYNKHPKFYKWFLDGAENIRKFENIVGYVHPDKQVKLKQLIDLYKNYSYFRPFPVDCTT